MDIIVEEMNQRLKKLVGCDVEEPLKSGQKRLTVSEKSRPLKFDSLEFEEGGNQTIKTDKIWLRPNPELDNSW